MHTYTALTCRTDRATLDLLSALGQSLPITGILDEGDAITLYFDTGALTPDVEATIREWIPIGVPADIERSNIDEQNWNAAFEQSLEPVRVAPNLVITQSWHPVEPHGPDDLIVVIDPKMAFGTGHHESTRLICLLLSRLNLVGLRVLDIGTGTGVLSIVACKRGAAYVEAIDNNEWAVENATENITVNRCTGIDVRLGDVTAVTESDFDIILANIHRNVIMELLPTMAEKLARRPGASVLTSGILIDDYSSLVDAARMSGLHPVEEETENEWIATRFERIPR